MGAPQFYFTALALKYFSRFHVSCFCFLQCFDTVGWVTGKTSGYKKKPVPLFIKDVLPKHFHWKIKMVTVAMVCKTLVQNCVCM